MSDLKQNNGSDSEFDRDRSLASRAYKNVEAALPPATMDDAIRAAARRAVQSSPQPHPVGKSWIARYSAPLSAAALVMLTVSIGFVALEERPELAPATISESIKPKAASSTPPAEPMNAPESPAPGVAQASRSTQPVPVAEKKVRADNQNMIRDQLAASPKPELERRREDDRVATSGALLSKESNATIAVDRPVVAAAPAPIVKDAQTFVADVATSMSAETLKREAVQEKQAVTQFAAAARSDAAQGMTPKSLVAPTTSRPQATPGASVAGASPPPAPAPSPSLLVKANETPDVWIKRILELKRQNKMREFEDELAKFHKRYPDYLLPEELKVRK